jgi:hypothetical protein
MYCIWYCTSKNTHFQNSYFLRLCCYFQNWTVFKRNSINLNNVVHYSYKVRDPYDIQCTSSNPTNPLATFVASRSFFFLISLSNIWKNTLQVHGISSHRLHVIESQITRHWKFRSSSIWRWVNTYAYSDVSRQRFSFAMVKKIFRNLKIETINCIEMSGSANPLTQTRNPRQESIQLSRCVKLRTLTRDWFYE